MKRVNKFQTRLAIVTGANGFTGRYVCKELMRNKIKFIALLRPGTNTNWFKNNSIKFRFADINNYESLLLGMHSCDTLINVASIGFGAAPVLIKACKKLEINRAIFVSTTAIFTKLKSSSKSIRLHAENKIIKSGLSYTIIRPTMIFGSKEDRNIFRLINFINKYPIIPVFQNGRGLQQPVFVEDVAWAIVSCIKESKTQKQIFNIAGPKAIKFSEMVEIISKKLDKTIIKISISSKIAILFIKLLNFIKIKFFISEEQVLRVIEDKSFSNKKAKELIKFQPKSFEFVINKQIQNYFRYK